MSRARVEELDERPYRAIHSGHLRVRRFNEPVLVRTARPKSRSTSVVPEAITETARSRIPFYRRSFSRSSFCAVANASFAGTMMSGFTPTPSQFVRVIGLMARA